MFLEDSSPEDGSNMFLRNVGTHLQVHAVSQLRRPARAKKCYGCEVQQQTNL
jgi:hypothetical protein